MAAKHKNTRRREARSANRPSIPWASLALCLGLVVLVFVAFWPAVGAGFIWDDDYHLTQNPHMQDASGLARIWSSRASLYYPLVSTAFWTMRRLWALNPLPYHIVQLLAHALVALLLWRVLRRMGVGGAWCAALIFAVHPANVDTAAWVTEYKNTQSGIFYLLAVWAFLVWRDGGRRPWVAYGVALALYLAALLSKTSTVMLPVALVIVDWWLSGRRFEWRRLAWTLPFFALSAAAAAWTVLGHESHISHQPLWNESVAERLVVAGRIPWFYLGKLLWPEPLMFIYPRWEVHAGRATAYLPGALALAPLPLLWRMRRRSWAGALLAVWAYFLASLFPVMWFFSGYFTRYSYVADHFQYLAAMGPIALIGWLLGDGLWRQWGLAAASGAPRESHRPLVVLSRARIAQIALIGIVLAALATRSHLHTRNYTDLETLWVHTLRENPDALLAHNNMGVIREKQGRLDEALAHYRAVLDAEPHHADVWRNLANVLDKQQRPDEAAEAYREALERDPTPATAAKAHYGLANILERRGKVDQAETHFRAALEINPRFGEAHDALGSLLGKTGRHEEALEHLRAALALGVDTPATHHNMGASLQLSGRTREAVDAYEKALRGGLQMPVTWRNLGAAWLELGDRDRARICYEKALERARATGQDRMAADAARALRELSAEAPESP